SFLQGRMLPFCSEVYQVDPFAGIFKGHSVKACFRNLRLRIMMQYSRPCIGIRRPAHPADVCMLIVIKINDTDNRKLFDAVPEGQVALIAEYTILSIISIGRLTVRTFY